jgi:hypothetical protein
VLGQMPRRYLFRMTYYQNLQIYFADGYLWAKNNPNVQRGYRISYEDIVARRGTPLFATPCGANVNDFVPFYFSPITKMAYTIHCGNVALKAPDGSSLGQANMDDVAYIVVEPGVLFKSGRSCWFTDIACNSAIPPNYENRQNKLDEHISWSLFDDTPRTALIPEIGYDGVCQWQHDRDEPVRFQQRSKRRMAEFMIKDHLRMTEVSCIMLKSLKHVKAVQSWVNASGMEIPVYAKPGCYF